jgi:hypothetical protein
LITANASDPTSSRIILLLYSRPALLRQASQFSWKTLREVDPYSKLSILSVFNANMSFAGPYGIILFFAAFPGRL